MNLIVVTGDGTLAKATREATRAHWVTWSDSSCREAELLWICHDTPLVDGKPDNASVLASIRKDICSLCGRECGSGPVLISSQIPIGTTKLLESEFPGVFIAYSPENVRVKTALEDFKNQARIVVGRRGNRCDTMFEELFEPFTKSLIFTDPETAEMIKHALNTFLGINIAFANEIADLCRIAGADMDVVTKALRSERRISPNAPLLAGGPFESGHLERDFYTLINMDPSFKLLPLIRGAMLSNDIRKQGKQTPEA